MATSGNDGFARDLGYLGPFLDKLEAHGRSMGGPGGDRLVALMREERQRWKEISELLAGRAPAAAPSSRGGTTLVPTSKADGNNNHEVRPVVSAGSFTVGSLRGSSGRKGES